MLEGRARKLEVEPTRGGREDRHGNALDAMLKRRRTSFVTRPHLDSSDSEVVGDDDLDRSRWQKTRQARAKRNRRREWPAAWEITSHLESGFIIQPPAALQPLSTLLLPLLVASNPLQSAVCTQQRFGPCLDLQSVSTPALRHDKIITGLTHHWSIMVQRLHLPLGIRYHGRLLSYCSGRRVVIGLLVHLERVLTR